MREIAPRRDGVPGAENGMADMKVTRVGGAKEASSTKRRGKAGDGDSFADSLREAQGTSSAGAATETSTVAAADAVLAAQSVGDSLDDAPTRKRLMSFGGDVLDRLDELRVGILLGRFPKEQLADLAQRLRQKRQESTDPRLNEIIQEIELRAEVEIAKYTRRS